MGGPMLLVIEIIIWLSYCCLCFLTMAICGDSIQYARRTASGDFEQDMMEVIDNDSIA
jgi:preprotein translocase subunit SecY